MGKLTDLDQRIDQLDRAWATQGRTEEQCYAVRNFLTGSGKNEIKQLIATEVAEAYKRGYIAGGIDGLTQEVAA